MNQLLNYTVLDKKNNQYPRGNDKTISSKVESNDQLISKLQDLISQAPLDNDKFGLFVDILVKKFNWRTAHADEIDKCKNIVLDLISIDGACVNGLIKSFISHFRSTDKEHFKVDICSKIFDSVLLLKRHIRNILTSSPDDVELAGENYELLYELLGYHSSWKVKNNVVSIFPSTHKNPRFNGLRCFFYRNKDGSVDFFSYARCCDNVKTRGQVLREHLCDMLVEIYRLTPSVLGTITETIDSLYPHHNVQIEHHISFTKAILYISRRIPCSRSVLYKILINKFTIIDSEIKLADPNSVDVEKVENLRSEKLKELANQLIKGQKGVEDSNIKLDNPDWFKSMYLKLRTEEDTDDMSQKLDFLMGIMLEELECVLKNNMNIPYASKIVETHYTSDSEDNDELCTPIAKNDLSSHYSSDTCYSQSNLDDVYATSTTVSSNGTDSFEMRSKFRVKLENGVKDKFVSSFEIDKYNSNGDLHNTVKISYNDTSKGNCTMVKSEPNDTDVDTDIIKQRVSGFGNLKDREPYGTNRMGYTVADMIIMDLFDTFDEIILPTYNCKYVQFIYFFVLSINHKWARMFLQRLFSIVYNNTQHAIRRRAAASYISSLICRSNYILTQYVCGSLNHLFGLLSYFECVTSASSKLKNVKSTNGVNRASLSIKSGSRRSNIQCFSLASAKLSLFYSILQDILYIICYRTDLISASPSLVSFIKDDQRGLIAYLDSYLKPLSYCKHSVITEAIKSTSYFPNLKEFHEYLVSAQSELQDSRRNSEDYRWSLYSPIDSFFPFDPYLLHHSRYYIRDKYRSETTAQSIESTKQEQSVVCKLVKSEPTEATKEETGLSNPLSPSAQHDLGLLSNEDYEHVDTDTHTKPLTKAEDSKDDKIINAVVDAIKNEKELVDKELESVTKHVHDSLGFSSISRSIKAKLDSYKRTHTSDYDHIEADYDFWGYETTIEELEEYTNQQLSELNNEDHIIVGIDQIKDLELSLCDSVLLKDVGERKHGLLDLLTSSRAYKSAALNSKRAREAIL